MNEEEGRRFVFDFLKLHENIKYTISSLHRSILKEHPSCGLSRYKVSLFLENMIALGLVKSFDVGYKVVWYENKDK